MIYELDRNGSILISHVFIHANTHSLSRLLFMFYICIQALLASFLLHLYTDFIPFSFTSLHHIAYHATLLFLYCLRTTVVNHPRDLLSFSFQTVFILSFSESSFLSCIYTCTSGYSSQCDHQNYKNKNLQSLYLRKLVTVCFLHW